MTTRLGAASLGLAGVLFLLYPAVRPYHDESTVDGAVAAMGSAAWVAAHLFAMIGFILLVSGLFALHHVLGTTLSTVAAAVTGIGAGLTLPYYGAEDFSLHAIATKFAQGQRFDLLDMIDSVRNNPVAITTFGIGLVLLGIGGVFAAVAIWRSGDLPRYSGIPFAAGFVLFIPQFFAPGPIRIAHGALVMAGALWVAYTMWTARSRSEKGPDRPASTPVSGPVRA